MRAKSKLGRFLDEHIVNPQKKYLYCPICGSEEDFLSAEHLREKHQEELERRLANPKDKVIRELRKLGIELQRDKDPLKGGVFR